jgi:hypothetical protein
VEQPAAHAAPRIVKPRLPVTRSSRASRCRVALGALGLSVGLCAFALPATQVEAAGGDKPVWTTQLVGKAGNADTFDLGRTFIDIGPSGRSVILYASGPNKQNGFDLRIARGPYPDGSFHIDRIDPTDKLKTGYGSLALGPKGGAHVSYVHGVFQDQGILKYAVRHPTGWAVETVDDTMWVGRTAIALDSHHQPVIAYTRTVAGIPELRIATHGSGGWVTSPVTNAPIQVLDLAIDANDHPEIAYIVNTDIPGHLYEARLATFDGASWSFEDVGFVSTPGIDFGIDLLINDHGKEDVVYSVYDPKHGLEYAHRTNTGWKLQLIAKGDLRWPSAAYDAKGHLHVVFYGATAGSLRYGALVDGQWHLQTIADRKSPHIRIGRFSAIAIGAGGRAHVSYYVGNEFTGTTLHYALSTPV